MQWHGSMQFQSKISITSLQESKVLFTYRKSIGWFKHNWWLLNQMAGENAKTRQKINKRCENKLGARTRGFGWLHNFNKKKKKVNAARRAPHGGSFGPQIMAKRWAGMWWSQRAGGLTHGKRLKIKASAKMKIITKWCSMTKYNFM